MGYTEIMTMDTMGVNISKICIKLMNERKTFAVKLVGEYNDFRFILKIIKYNEMHSMSIIIHSLITNNFGYLKTASMYKINYTSILFWNHPNAIIYSGDSHEIGVPNSFG